jgi:hypothetical protein
MLEDGFWTQHRSRNGSTHVARGFGTQGSVSNTLDGKRDSY